MKFLGSVLILFSVLPMASFGQSTVDETPCYDWNGPWQCPGDRLNPNPSCGTTPCEENEYYGNWFCPVSMVTRDSLGALTGKSYNDALPDANDGLHVDADNTDWILCSELEICSSECNFDDLDFLTGHCVEIFSVPLTGGFDYELDEDDPCEPDLFGPLP